MAAYDINEQVTNQHENLRVLNEDRERSENALLGSTHRDDRVDDDEQNVHDSSHDGGDDIADSRDNRALRMIFVNRFLGHSTGTHHCGRRRSGR